MWVVVNSDAFDVSEVFVDFYVMNLVGECCLRVFERHGGQFLRC